MLNDHEIEQCKVDRLVDGELSEPERRALFLELDSNPTGWKRCALAFLEAQAWQEAFEPVAVAAPSRIPISISPKNHRWTWVKPMSSIAASMLLAFTLGWFAKGRGVVDRPVSTQN